MLSLYEILKASKTGIAPDMWTALAGMNWGGADSGAEIKELTGIPPLSFTADGTPLLDYLISGNAVQNGTPTPDNPIQPQETGERTANLWDGNYENGVLNPNGTLDAPNYNYNTTMYIPTEEKNYTLSVICNYDPGLRLLRVCFYDENKNFISYVDSSKFKGKDFFYKFNFTAPVNSKYLRFSYIFRANMSDTNIMLNLGSEALPYEPYGYKIPISSAGQTTPIYLGEVQTTRRIRKLVFDGTENWKKFNNLNYTFEYNPSSRIINGLCSHYPKYYGANFDKIDGIYLSNTNAFIITDLRFTTPTDFKSFLATQYAAGTPVTVWYVLATETTDIVNEPLRKIGDYADTVSMEQAGVQIPTNRGNTVIDVETELKPSQMYIKYQE